MYALNGQSENLFIFFIFSETKLEEHVVILTSTQIGQVLNVYDPFTKIIIT